MEAKVFLGGQERIGGYLFDDLKESS